MNTENLSVSIIDKELIDTEKRQTCANAHHPIGPDKPFLEFKKTETNQSIVDRFERQVVRYPSRLAVKTEKTQLTYAAFNQTANRAARAIVEQRGQRSEPVAIFLDQGVSLISALFAVLKAGKSYIVLDTSFPPSKNASVVKHSQPGLILTDRKYYPLARKLVDNTSQLLIIDEISSEIPSGNLDLSISPETTAYIIYTSGSTGDPKGVFQDHRNVLHNVMRCTNMLHIAADDRLSLLWSCSFAASVPNIFGALLNGAALLPFDLKKEGIIKLADWLIKEKISIYHSVPTVYRHFLSTLTGMENFSNLRLIKLSGEPVLRTDVELYRKHFHEGCYFHVSYASTETNIVRQFFCDHNTAFCGDIVPVGYEVEDMEVLLFDEDGKEVGVNCVGEIAIRSPYLPPTYYRKEDLTESPFMPDEKDGYYRIYKTGDLGYMLPDRCLLHLGRKDMQVKIRGYRVEVGEVEMALNELSVIKEAAVEGRDDPYGRKLLVAYVVLHKNKTISAAELRNFLKDRIPDYMVPSRFLFLEGLPLTMSGKLDRRALPDPEHARLEIEKDYVAPRTQTEVTLAEIWSNIFGIKHVGVFDNFFDLGGHSLLVVQLAAEIKKITGKTLPIIAILQSPTIEQLAKVLNGEVPTAGSPSVVVQADGSRLPLFWVGVNIYLPRHLGPDQPGYGLLSQGQYDNPVIYDTVEELAAKHLEEIRTVQPEGPYLLGGYCFWGVVAFEMAQQLLRQGEDVRLLCLVDPPSRLVRPKDLDKVSSSQHASFTSRSKHFFSTMSAQKDDKKADGILQVIRRSRIVRNIKVSVCKTCIFFGYPVPSILRMFYCFRVAREEIVRKYRPQVYPGRAVVFLAGDASGVSRPDWSRLAASEVIVHEVPGARHVTMTEEPFVGTWAKQLNSYLEATRATKVH